MKKTRNNKFINSIRSIPSHIIALGIALITFIGLIALVTNLSSFTQPEQTKADTPTTFTLSTISSSTEVVGSLRGLYRWRNQQVAPVEGTDSYERFDWKDLEPTQDNYNFGSIDNKINDAKSRGMTFSMRIRAMVTESVVPNYVKSNIGWSTTPNWNSPYFLDRYRKLYEALGRRYANNPVISYIDIGTYGKWGEGHCGSCAYKATNPSKEAMVNMVTNNFPPNKVVAMTDDTYMLIYALRKSPLIGWRRDSLGDPWFEEGINRYKENSSDWELISNRWKTAPVVSELFGVRSRINYSTVLSQVKNLHVSLVSNGNTDATWSSLSQTQKDQFLASGRAAGYRLHITKVSTNSPLRPNSSNTISSSWSNVGNAPVYENWNVMYQLRNSTNRVVWESKSGINLKTILPNTPTIINDAYTLPSSLSAGTYKLELIIKDPTGYRKPLALAINGRQPDGSYAIGNITVSSAIPVSTPNTSYGTNYKGMTLYIPGKIESEFFNEGSEGVAYHDTTVENQSTSGRLFRNTGVDVQESGNGGYNIAWTKKSEFLAYTVKVQQTGNYRMSLNVSNTSNGGIMHAEFDGIDKTGPIIIPNTGSWQTYKSVPTKTINLSQGYHILKLVMDSEASSGYTANIDYMQFNQQ